MARLDSVLYIPNPPMKPLLHFSSYLSLPCPLHPSSSLSIHLSLSLSFDQCLFIRKLPHLQQFMYHLEVMELHSVMIISEVTLYHPPLIKKIVKVFSFTVLAFPLVLCLETCVTLLLHLLLLIIPTTCLVLYLTCIDTLTLTSLILLPITIKNPQNFSFCAQKILD